MPSFKKILAGLCEYALSFPGAVEDFPWGERTFKVGGKIFLWLDDRAEGLHVTAKLPESSGMAVMIPGVEPAGYGLGRAGWVSATFDPHNIPVEILMEWMEESYRAVAPKKLAAEYDKMAGAGARKRTRR